MAGDPPYRIRVHPKVRSDLEVIARVIADYSGRTVAKRRLAETEATIAKPGDTPRRGSQRHEIAPGIRAIPAGRRAVVVFVVDDLLHEVRVVAISYGGADWIARVSEGS